MKTPAMELGLAGSRWSRALAVVQGESHVVLQVREDAVAAASPRPPGDAPAARVVHFSAEQAATGRYAICCRMIALDRLDRLH